MWVYPIKNGYLTSVRPPNHHFDQKSQKEDFFWPDSIKERRWESQNPICKSFSLEYRRKLCFSVFYGSNTHDLMGDSHFFFSEKIL